MEGFMRVFKGNRIDADLIGPVVFPVEVCPYREIGKDVDDIEGRAVREGAPYRKGDVIYIKNGITGGVFVGRVLFVGSQYLRTKGYWIPRYRVQRITRKGTWSGTYYYVNPGDIHRAWHEDDKPVRLPKTVDSPYDVRNLADPRAS
jgi:hypothetical protein